MENSIHRNANGITGGEDESESIGDDMREDLIVGKYTTRFNSCIRVH